MAMHKMIPGWTTDPLRIRDDTLKLLSGISGIANSNQQLC
jgi:hypothetical protein